ncbi:MAG: hypothetical protein PHH29_17115 [Desulfuromonadaceae bacterium]|nr:hypothetical protein [Desulfuromonadaceae bacterium]
MSIRIRSYKSGSKSAKALANYMNVLILKQTNSKFRPRLSDVIINWGSSQPIGSTCSTINYPSSVTYASNKLLSFNKLNEAGVSIPRFTTDINIADANYERVFVRHTLTGHSGEGIEVINTGSQCLPNAPLYVEAIRKKNEYRVIVVDGEVVDIKQKRLSTDAPEDRSRYVRNLNNGWIFSRDNVEYVEGLNEIGIEAVNALGLDFGAVDIITDCNDKLYVLEVNTAFGLEGKTIELVGEALKKLIRKIGE